MEIFTDKIIKCLPFLQDHIQNLHVFLIIGILVECLASISWPVEFIDVSVF
jgi:hypothetical protein